MTKPAPAPRVAFFSDSLPERNGSGAYYHDLAGQLAKQVDHLEMFQPADKRRMLRLAAPLPGDPTQKLIAPNIPRLWRQFARMRPNVVVSVTPGPFGLLGLALARRFKTGFMTAFHTHFEELVRMYFNPVSFHITYGYLINANRLLCRRSHTVLVNNSDLIPVCQQLGAQQVDVVGTPLPASFLEDNLAPPPQSLDKVLFAGRLAPEKNLPAILEAARALPDLQFTLAGDGPLRKKLTKEAEDLKNVTFAGWLNRDQLRNEMDATSLLLLPSHLETFGTVALESMARGRPALVSANAGIHDWSILKDGLFALCSEESLAEALIRIRQQKPEDWMRKSKAARQAALELNLQTIDQWVELTTRCAGHAQALA